MSMKPEHVLAAFVSLAVVLAFVPASSAQNFLEHLTGWQMEDKDNLGRYSRFVVVNNGYTSAIVTYVGYYYSADKTIRWVDVPDFVLVINENKAVDVPENYRDADRIVVLTARGNTWTMLMRPVADFTYAQAPDNSVQFTDRSSDKDGRIMSWSWNFGDNGTSTARNPSHLYTSYGTFTVKLTVTDDDGLTGTTTKIFAADFSVSVNPTSGSVTQGNSTGATVSVSLAGNFGSTVSLTASGLPSDASASFSPSSGTPSFNSTMTISTSSSTPTGTYAITITGTGGGLTRTAAYSLTVNASGGGGGGEPPPPPPSGSTQIAVSIGSADGPAPSSAQVTVAGVAKTVYPGSWTYWDVSPGTYTVSFGSVSYYRTPSDQTVTVDSGQVVSVTGYYNIGKWRFLQAGELGFIAAQSGITKYNTSTGTSTDIQVGKATIGLGWNNGDQFWAGGSVNISLDHGGLFTSYSMSPTNTTPNASGTLITVSNVYVTGTWTASSYPILSGTSVNFPGYGGERPNQQVGWSVQFVS